MDGRIREALDTGRVIDITTTGRKSGAASRKEMWFHTIDGEVYITGTPGTRDWYANVLAYPSFTFHLKEGIQADLPAVARPVTAEAEKRAVLTAILARLNRDDQLEAWVEGSPVIHVAFSESS